PERGREVARPLYHPYGIIARHCSIVVPRCRGLDCLLNVDQAEAAVFPRMPADANQYGQAQVKKLSIDAIDGRCPTKVIGSHLRLRYRGSWGAGRGFSTGPVKAFIPLPNLN